MLRYLELNRRFVERPKYVPEELVALEVTGKRVDWTTVLANRFSLIVGPANFGKTVEMQERAARMRSGSEAAVFVALRKLVDRGSLERALETDDRDCYQDWKAAPTTSLTLFVDSLDEAAAGKKGRIEYLVSDLAEALSWPNRQVRWVISTRPAVLTSDVMEKLGGILLRPITSAATLTPSVNAAVSASATTTEAIDSRSQAESEKLHLFSLVPLNSKQSEAYLTFKHPALDARGILEIARDRGLSGFTTSPGGLDVLAQINLIADPPESLTTVFQRVIGAVQDLHRQDQRLEEAGNPAPAALAEAAQKLASASQVCQLANIEIPEDRLGVTDGVLSARLIASSTLPERALNQLLNSQLFIDVGYHQVKLYPDVLSPFLGAQRLAALTHSPEQAHRLVQLFTWRAPTGEQGIYRHLLPLMGWLATLNSHCREEILECDPQAVAFFGDLRNRQMPLAAARQALDETIRRMVEQGDKLGRGMFSLTSENFWQAGNTELEPLLRRLFTKYRRHHWARDALLEIVTNSRSAALRDLVLDAHGRDYRRLLDETMDVHYLLQLGVAGDLQGLAEALKAEGGAPEGLVASLISRLAWTHLTPADLAGLVHKQFSSGRGGFQIAYTLGGGVLDQASDQQLYSFSRSLILRVVRLYDDDDGHRRRNRRRIDDRYAELVIDALASLISRDQFPKHRRVALLCLLMQRVLDDIHMGSSERSDLRHALAENTSVRRDLLTLVVRRSRQNSEHLWTALYGYRSILTVVPADIEALNAPELNSVFEEQQENEARSRANQPPPHSARDERMSVDRKARAQLLAMVEHLKDGSGSNGLAWSARWLLQTNPNSRYGEISFELFQREVGSEIGQAVRAGFSRVWRDRPPRYDETAPQTTYHITVAGLQGLHLELGEGKKLPQLSDEEVRRALRYAAFEINGHPKWFWPLVTAHQEVAAEELLDLIRRSDKGSLSRQHAENLLTSIEEAPAAVQAKLAPLAWAYLLEHQELSDYLVEKLLTMAAKVPGVVTQVAFEKTAWTKMQEPFAGISMRGEGETPGVEAARSQGVLWGSRWLTDYPKAFRKALDKWLTKTPNDARKFIFQLAAYLGRDRGAKLVQLTQVSDDGIAALGALYEWLVQVVSPENDNDHADGEVYEPSPRDHAEQLRDALIPAIAAAKSQLAYETLGRLRTSETGPRAMYLQRVQFEMREAQYARPPLAQQKYNDFERDFIADVTDTTSFAMAIHSDLLTVKYAIEQGEYSLRRFFSGITLKRAKKGAQQERDALALEADFQRLLASELHHHARDRYSVTVEPHTPEQRRRDVLCSKGSMFASVELKMSTRWTLEKYLEALEKQLVGQYMRHRKATIGFLVIVLQERQRTWVDGASGEKIGFAGLLSMLQRKALALEANDRRRYLRVIGIDATAPENFRVTKKQTPKKTSRRKSARTMNPGMKAAAR